MKLFSRLHAGCPVVRNQLYDLRYGCSILHNGWFCPSTSLLLFTADVTSGTTPSHVEWSFRSILIIIRNYTIINDLKKLDFFCT